MHVSANVIDFSGQTAISYLINIYIYVNVNSTISWCFTLIMKLKY